jgi:predicted amidohydrolase
MVQAEGPLPSAKISAVTPSGRETFAWSSIEEVERRIDKAADVVDFITRNRPETNVILFPEYSVPVELALTRLQRLADLHKVIIIPGADNISQQRRRRVYNQCPIIIPQSKPVWITKQNLSQWEEGKIDTPPASVSPLFTWTHDGRAFYFTVNICLDFPMVIRDVTPAGNDPLIHLVPMCSPETTTFRTYADTVLWEAGGRAVFLCNCVGANAAGGSALFAVTPTGARLRPVVSLTNNNEGIACIELYCDRLVPPKRTSKEPRVAVGQVYQYDIQTSEE